MNPLEHELALANSAVLSTERWAKQYSKAPDQHAQLVKLSSQLLIILTRYYKQMAANAEDFVNWDHYNFQVSQGKPAGLDRQTLDYDVKVIVNDQQIDQSESNFINLTLQTVTNLIATGAQAGENIYKVPLGIQSTDAIIQHLGTKHVANLVGKTVKADGSIVDNPNADYNVSDTVRADIAQSVKTSLALGEDKAAAVARMQTIISNPARATRIANTESVNAFNAGTLQFGTQSGAVGMEWQTAGATDICADNEDEGPIAIDDTFVSGDSAPPAHPNCMCAIRLIYQQEWDDEGYGN